MKSRRRGRATRWFAGAALLIGTVAGSTALASSQPAAAKSGNGSTLSVTSFTNHFSAMTKLKRLAASGKGKIAVILPDTVSSARYTEFDAPYLARAFKAAGLAPSQYSIQNAQGSDTTQLTDAQSAVPSGAHVLVVDPLDSGVGASIETYAKAHGVAVVDYDRLTLGGSRQYYVSFNNVNVGKLIGKGLETCVTSWHVAKPKVVVMAGAPTDNNAALFAQGYNSALKAKFKSGGWTLAASPAGTWDPPTAETEFQQAFAAHAGVNAVLMPNDETAAPVVTYLKSLNITPGTFPVTGQDATLVGLQNVISGYQCGTVYKPVYLEAQAAASLALYLRAGTAPPKGLVNGSTTDTTSHQKMPSALLVPEWVTPAMVESTVVKDGFVTAAQLCAGAYASDCSKYGISYCRSPRCRMAR
jgi:D-xylose transport system substrate-binding protein